MAAPFQKLTGNSALAILHFCSLSMPSQTLCLHRFMPAHMSGTLSLPFVTIESEVTQHVPFIMSR